MKNKVNLVLIVLIILDFSLATVCLIAPEFWIRLFHGVSGQDSLGLVRRLGAVWAAFFLFQLIAWRRWPLHPHWLVLVAGIRWTEVCSDWVYAAFAQHLTWFGWLGLLSAPPINFLAGWYLLWAYHRKMAAAPSIS